MDSLEIKILTYEYVEESLKMFNDVFNLSRSMNFWKEKHFENPMGNSIFVGAFDNEKLIAIMHSYQCNMYIKRIYIM